MVIPNTVRQQDEGLPVAQTPAEVPSSRVPALRKSPEPPFIARRRRWLLWLTGGVVAALAGGLAYLQPWTGAVTPVTVEQVTVAPVTRLLAVNGRIASVHSVDVRPLVGGSLTEVVVSEGQRVDAGQVLARIDTTAQDAVVRQALAGLDAALVAQEQAEANYARSLALGPNISAVVREADRRVVQSTIQDVARMTALLEQAQVQLGRHTLRAWLN